ncbi:MAG: ribonuclease H-like domain-containing protein [Bilifractor sp.]
MLKREEEIAAETSAQIREYFPYKNAVLFDIETTGLSWRTSHLYLIGVLFCSDGKWWMRQWFLDRPAEEKDMLMEFAAFLEELKMQADQIQLVHFNGEMFDLPYIRHKCGFYGLTDPFAQMRSIDIYRQIRPIQKVLGLSSMKQKAVENFLRIQRDDLYTGGELIPIYQKYLQSGDRSLEKLLFLHNHDDVIGMAEILPVLSYAGFFQGNFSLSAVSERLSGNHKWIVFSMKAKHDFPVPVQYAGEEIVLELGMQKEQPDKASLMVLSCQTEMKHFFPDYKNYYYFPAEDQAIHKDVAIYADSGHREKAKASNCYQRAKGTFLPQMSEIFQPVFYKDYHTRPMYFRIEDLRKKNAISDDGASFDEKEQKLFRYLLGLLQTLGKKC